MERPIGVEADSTTWPVVLAFAVEMEKKLAKNRHKGDRAGWLWDDPLDLLHRVREETDELAHELLSAGPVDGDALIREAADVANMAMMVADACTMGCSPKGGLLERALLQQQQQPEARGSSSSSSEGVSGE